MTLALLLDLVWEDLSVEDRSLAISVLLGIASKSDPNRAGAFLSTQTMIFLACYGKEADSLKIDYKKGLGQVLKWWKEEAISLFRMRGHSRGGGWLTTWGDCQCQETNSLYLNLAWGNITGEKLIEENWFRCRVVPMIYSTYPSQKFRDLKAVWGRKSGQGFPSLVPEISKSSFDQFIWLWGMNTSRYKLTKRVLGLNAEKGKAQAAGLKKLTGKKVPWALVSPFYNLTTFWVLAGGFDPAQPSFKLSELPETALFEGEGVTVMRSSWKGDATFCVFRAGNTYGGKGKGDSRLNNLAFFIYKDTPLTTLPSAGTTRSPIYNIVSIFNPNEPGFYNPNNTSKRNVSPNGCQKENTKYLLRAMPKGDEHHRGRIYEQTKMVGFETTAQYDYMAADGTKAYGESSVKECVRQLVFIKPDYFVIFDRVTARKAEFPKRWNIHFYDMCEPFAEGSAFKAQWTGKVKPGTYKNRSKYCYSGVPGVGKPAGTLFGRILLPKEVKIDKLVLDFDKFDQKIFGGNTTLRQVHMESEKMPGKLLGRLSLMKLEIGPKSLNKRDLFLTVLQASKTGVKEMIPCELVKQGKRVGAKLKIGEKEVTVMFDKDGALKEGWYQTGGSIAINGETKEFPQKIIDSYQGWKDDPRFKSWMTDERFELIIPETDRKKFQK